MAIRMFWGFMATLAVQYLESPYPDASPARVHRRLRQAFERLPINLVLLGWELPPALEEAVTEEAARQHAYLYRWQPLLTGDVHTDLPLEWATIGPGGNPIPGYVGMPEFSFICLNRTAVADFLAERVESIADSGFFQGLFLDGIRLPSPAIDPRCDLACFCKPCTHLATDMVLDLESVRKNIKSLSEKNHHPQLAGTSYRSLLFARIVPRFPLRKYHSYRPDRGKTGTSTQPCQSVWIASYPP